VDEETLRGDDEMVRTSRRKFSGTKNVETATSENFRELKNVEMVLSEIFGN
jgi:hypothetical protein